jgi:hypothetical protein
MGQYLIIIFHDAGVFERTRKELMDETSSVRIMDICAVYYYNFCQIPIS